MYGDLLSVVIFAFLLSYFRQQTLALLTILLYAIVFYSFNIIDGTLLFLLYFSIISFRSGLFIEFSCIVALIVSPFCYNWNYVIKVFDLQTFHVQIDEVLDNSIVGVTLKHLTICLNWCLKTRIYSIVANSLYILNSIFTPLLKYLSLIVFTLFSGLLEVSRYLLHFVDIILDFINRGVKTLADCLWRKCMNEKVLPFFESQS